MARATTRRRRGSWRKDDAVGPTAAGESPSSSFTCRVKGQGLNLNECECECECTRVFSPVDFSHVYRRQSLNFYRCTIRYGRESMMSLFQRAPVSTPCYERNCGGAVPTVVPASQRVNLPLPLRALRRYPTAVPLRQCGADRHHGTAARRSAAATAGAPATLPPFRSGGAVPTVVPVLQRVDLPLPLRALWRPHRCPDPAAH